MHNDYYDELEWMDNANCFDWIKFYLAIVIMMIVLFPILIFQSIKDKVVNLFTKHN